jgi:hypothetical protein
MNRRNLERNVGQFGQPEQDVKLDTSDTKVDRRANTNANLKSDL